MGNSSYIFQIGDENINVKLKKLMKRTEQLMKPIQMN